MTDFAKMIEEGDVFLGIELGSTRIKSILIDSSGSIIGKGNFDWENKLSNGFWSYDLDEVWRGIQSSYQNLSQNVQNIYGTPIRHVSAMGISAMMHGYLPFDSQGNQLTAFRTWRNNTTERAAQKLSHLFQYNIPQRWSIAHLYESILNNEPHVAELDYITTLSGYIHWKLTGQKVLGIGDASGMFPIDIEQKSFDQIMIDTFNNTIRDKCYTWRLQSILPQVLVAGQTGGYLTAEGATLIDPSGSLQPGIPLCPPEGDAGTGMVATNSIKVKTGNISAGTSVFAMIVLEKALSKVYSDLDMVTTPTGDLVAMAHSNNCSTDIDAWIKLFGETLMLFGVEYTNNQLYEKLFSKALEGDMDCGGLLAYGFHSGEHSVNLSQGCPLVLHPTEAHFNLANFIRVHLYTAFGAMKLGMDLLIQNERVEIDQILGHGGIFKSAGVAQQILSSAIGVPIAVMDTAGEGGAWGIALLAAYVSHYQHGHSLAEFLDEYIFKHYSINVIQPDPKLVQGYKTFIANYQRGLAVERAAVEYLNHQ